MYRIFYLLFVMPLFLFGAIPQPNILAYGEGSIQITASIDNASNLVAGVPLTGSIMITHDTNQPIDANSFRLGDQPLKATFVQSTKMSDTSSLQVTIYSFILPAMTNGSHILQPISVKVAGKYYQAPVVGIQIGQ